MDAALVRTVPKSHKSQPVLSGPTTAICPAERECALRRRHGAASLTDPRRHPTTGGRARGKGDPYPVCPTSGQWRKAAPLGLSPATEGQLKHRADTDSKGSLPSGLKLFCSTSQRRGEGAEPLGRPDHAPRSWCSPGGTRVARRPGPPPFPDLTVPPRTQSPPPRAPPGADEGLDPRARLCTPVLEERLRSRQGVGF